ncbi:MAG: hypothetical protein ACYDA5_06035 [Vulcanimicrobiaceae bacterium]
MRLRTTVLTALALAALSACGANSSGSAQRLADGATRAIYADSYAGVVKDLGPNVSRTVTRASVGAISDKMHALGSYQGLTLLASNPAKSEFTYRAAFQKGSMNVEVRLDNNGKLAAYRVFPTAS